MIPKKGRPPLTLGRRAAGRSSLRLPFIVKSRDRFDVTEPLLLFPHALIRTARWSARRDPSLIALYSERYIKPSPTFYLRVGDDTQSLLESCQVV